MPATKEAESYTISALARAVDVNVETIRYYERIDLLRRPKTPARGWRQYPPDALQRLRFIKRCQRLGFKLEEVRSLLGLRTSSSAKTCLSVSRKAKEKIAEIDIRIRDLEAMRGALLELSAACPSDGVARTCPLLDALETDGDL